MQQHDLGTMRQEIIAAVHRLLSSGIMQVSHHGNMTSRVPGTDTLLFTAAGGLDDLKPESIALLDLDGNILEGTVDPVALEVVAMHTVVFKLREETGSVLHTHSPMAFLDLQLAGLDCTEVSDCRGHDGDGRSVKLGEDRIAHLESGRNVDPPNSCWRG